MDHSCGVSRSRSQSAPLGVPVPPAAEQCCNDEAKRANEMLSLCLLAKVCGFFSAVPVCFALCGTKNSPSHPSCSTGAVIVLTHLQKPLSWEFAEGGGQNVSCDFLGGQRTIKCPLQNQFWRPQKMGFVWSVPVSSKENDRA